MKYKFNNVRGLQKAQVRPEDVIKVDGSDNYSVFYFLNGKQITLAKTLKQCEDIFEPYSFFRTHRSSIINIQHCTAIFENEILLKNNLRASISRRRKLDFLKTLNSTELYLLHKNVSSVSQ